MNALKQYNAFGTESQTGSIPVVEMGSQSVQIAIEGFNPKEALDRYVYEVTIGNRPHHIFCYSYPSLGIDELEENYTNSLAQEAGTATIKSPCYPEGATLQFDYLDVTGTPNDANSYETCSADLRKYSLLRFNSCKTDFCSFEGIPLPYDLSTRGGTWWSHHQSVHALSVYTYASQEFLGKDAGYDNRTIQETEEFARELCSMDWNKLKETYPSASENYLKKYCLQMTASHIWLRDGLGLKETDTVTRIWKVSVEE